MPKLKEIIDFERFRNILEPVFENTGKKSNAGRKPIDPVFMFRVLFLQRLYGLSDAQIEYHIKDRTSFRDFLGIQSVDDVPDGKTVWKYKDALAQSGTYDLLFKRFNEYLDSIGLIVNEGKIIDASFVIAPRQRNTREENRKIKEGKGDDLWNDNPHKKCHKDTDARWAKKRDEKHYGYKLHAKADKKTKLIEKYVTTDASVHDSNVIKPLIEEKDKGQPLYLDAGYESKDDVVRECGMTPVICEKGHRNNPLTEEQKQSNRQKSKTRCRVEHIFGFIEGSMNGSFVRSIGIIRAKAATALTCLVYNIFRYVQINKYQPQLIASMG